MPVGELNTLYFMRGLAKWDEPQWVLVCSQTGRPVSSLRSAKRVADTRNDALATAGLMNLLGMVSQEAPDDLIVIARKNTWARWKRTHRPEPGLAQQVLYQNEDALIACRLDRKPLQAIIDELDQLIPRRAARLKKMRKEWADVVRQRLILCPAEFAKTEKRWLEFEQDMVADAISDKEFRRITLKAQAELIAKGVEDRGW